jgi:hypothetical protein
VAAFSGRLALGDNLNACAINSSGQLVCWGWGAVPFAIDEATDMVQVTAFSNPMCVRHATGLVDCWTGSGGTPWSETPDGAFDAVAAGPSGVACGLRSGGAAECWGTNAPTDTPSGSFLQIDAGFPVCGVRPTGTVECWARSGMQVAPTGTDFTRVVAGVSEACALSPRGIECWSTTSGATQVASGQFIALDLGETQRCAIRSDNTVYCWQGTSTLTGRYVDIVLGELGTGCAVRVDGTVECWGATELAVPADLRLF